MNKLRGLAIAAVVLICAGALYQNCSRARFDFRGPGVDTQNVSDDGNGGGENCPCDHNFPEKVDQKATLAFEDNYPSPGDADFNDMVVNFQIKENFNKQGHLESVKITYVPKVKISGYNHKLLLMLGGKNQSVGSQKLSEKPYRDSLRVGPAFEGEVTDIIVTNTRNGIIEREAHYKKMDEIVVYEDSNKLFANTGPLEACVEIILASPELNPIADRQEVIFRNYRHLMYVIGSDQYVDVVDSIPTAIDKNGFPWGITVPADFSPSELTIITKQYPHFKDYMEWLQVLLTQPDAVPSDCANYWYTADCKAL